MPLPYSKLSPGQKAMADDGCPLACFPTPKERDAYRAWCAKNPPTVVRLFQPEPKNETPETVAFRVAEEERKRLKSLAQIARMKNRFATKAVDFSKVRWDARRNKFVSLTGTIPVLAAEPVTRSSGASRERKADRPNREFKSPDGGQPRITKDNAEAIARLNGVWKPEYEKLRGTGRIVMTVGNLLRSIVKRGGEVKWLK